MLRTIFISATILMSASAASAQQKAVPKPVTRAEYTAKIDQTFKNVDTNHNGFLEANEIQAQTDKDVNQAKGVLIARMRGAFNQLDTNKDGQLSFAEYAAQMTSIRAKDSPQQVIQESDTNHDGKISPAEFRASKMIPFDKTDLNHDGTVTPDEERRAAAAAQRK